MEIKLFKITAILLRQSQNLENCKLIIVRSSEPRFLSLFVRFNFATDS